MSVEGIPDHATPVEEVFWLTTVTTQPAAKCFWLPTAKRAPNSGVL